MPGACDSNWSCSGERGSAAGLGLGLFIAAEIVAGHGGRIKVESTEQDGTLFAVILPSFAE